MVSVRSVINYIIMFELSHCKLASLQQLKNKAKTAACVIAYINTR